MEASGQNRPPERPMQLCVLVEARRDGWRASVCGQRMPRPVVTIAPSVPAPPGRSTGLDRAATVGNDRHAAGLRAVDLDGDGESEIVAHGDCGQPGPYTHFGYAVPRGTRYGNGWHRISLTRSGADGREWDDDARRGSRGEGTRCALRSRSRARQGVVVRFDEVRSLQAPTSTPTRAGGVLRKQGPYVHDASHWRLEIRPLTRAARGVAWAT